MKRILFFAVPLLAFLLLALLFGSRIGKNSEELPTALAGQPLPVFSLPTLDGGTADQSQLKGPLLINVWATWCPSCYEEHPYLLQLAQQGVTLIGVNYKDDPAAARKYLAERGSPYRTVILDIDGRLGMDLGVYGAPETFVVDAQGHIRHRIAGVLTPENFAKEIAPFLRVAAPVTVSSASASGEAAP